VLVFVVLALFGRVVSFPFIAYDDAEFILRNPQVTAPLAAPLDLLLTPRVGYIVPVTISFEALLFALSGGAAWAFHAAALALHALFVLQVFAFARRLGARVPLAFGAALLFAVHPLVAQPVSWAICLKDLLMANLLIGATRIFVDVADGDTKAGTHKAISAFGLALLAMLAKPSAALIGLAWLAYTLAARAASRDGGPRATARGVAWATIGAGAVIGLASRYSHEAILASNAAATWTPSAPLIVLAHQVLHVLWPVDLLVVYPPPHDDPTPGLGAAAGAVIALLVAALLVRLRHHPKGLLVALIAAAVYLPTSDLLPFGRTASDSYAYVPLACLAIGLALTLERAFAARPLPSGVAALGLALAAALAAGTSLQLPRWRGGAALWGPVVRAHPRLATAHRLMGDEFVFRGEHARAVEPYRRSFHSEYDPRYLLEFGTILGMAGRIQDAECVLIEAAAYGPDHGYALFNYATLLAFHAADYQPHYAAPARQLLHEFERARRAGHVAFPEALAPGLAAQIARVDAQPAHDAPWPQRNCRVLQAR
jgi:hypothetical protein